MTSETRYLLVQCEYLRSFEYNEKICNDALSVTFFPIGIAFSSSTWRILVYPGVRWVKFNFCSIFICFKHFPCCLYIFTKQKYSKKLTYTLSFQRDHIVLEPTGSDVVNCVSKGKSQVISDWPNYPVVTLLKFPIIILFESWIALKGGICEMQHIIKSIQMRIKPLQLADSMPQ